MSGTTRVSRYQKGKTRKVKTNLDLLEQEIVSGNGICWAICKSAPHPRQPCQHPTTQFFTGRMPFLPPNQQCQSTEGIDTYIVIPAENAQFRQVVLDHVTESALRNSSAGQVVVCLSSLVTHTHTTVLRLCGICPGQPGWAGTRRNIHPQLGNKTFTELSLSVITVYVVHMSTILTVSVFLQQCTQLCPGQLINKALIDWSID